VGPFSSDHSLLGGQWVWVDGGGGAAKVVGALGCLWLD